MKFIWNILAVIPVMTVLALDCPDCGTKNEDGDRYCISCMSEMTAVSPENKEDLDQ